MITSPNATAIPLEPRPPPRSAFATIAPHPAKTSANVANATYSKGVVSVRTGSLAGGKHTIELVVSDYQEAKNMEDVLRILPNTRDFKASFSVG